MPSFDIVSKVDVHELTNAVDQANREIQTRYDFKGVNAKFELDGDKINLSAEVPFQLKQMLDILQSKLIKRGVEIKALTIHEPSTSMNQAKQLIEVKQGIDQPTAKSIVKIIKDEKLKVQASILGDRVRVTGKKRDDLQTTIHLLEHAEISLPLQFDNFRD